MVAFDSRAVVLGLRIAQAVLAVIILGITAYVAHWWTHWYHVSTAPGPDAFLLFSSIWTMLALAYLIIVPWRFSETKAHHMYAILVAEAVTMIFWFAGFIAMAVFLSGRPCWGHVCSAAKAAAVFGAFEWVLFAATTAMAVMHVVRTHDRAGHDGKANKNINVQDSV